jgi:hypothetical protein
LKIPLFFNGLHDFVSHNVGSLRNHRWENLKSYSDLLLYSLQDGTTFRIRIEVCTKCRTGRYVLKFNSHDFLLKAG